MEESGTNNKYFIRDMGWYLVGSIIPMGVGFIKTPIFTRYFTPEEYGYLGIVTITFTYISIFLYSWLSSCLWRYYNAFKNKNNLKGLYSNMTAIYLVASALLLISSGVWYVLADLPLVRNLIILSFIQYFIKEFIGLYLIIIRLEGKAFKYNAIHSMRAVLSFGVLYYMTFVLDFRIEAMILSTIIIDVLALLFILFFSREGVSVSLTHISRNTLKLLLKFGSVGLVSNFFFLLITTSDRYIIALYTDMSTVGIYNQVYNICQLSVVALVTVYFNTINPKLNKELEIDFTNSAKLIQDYLFVFLMFGLPVVTYLSMFPREIAFILLGESFRSGYVIMPWIFISSYMYGLFLFIEIRFKFADKLRNIAIGVFLASVLNLVLNFIMIPLYGYQWAAITTFIAYVFIVLYFYLQDSAGFFQNRSYLRKTLFFILILAVELVIDYVIRENYVLSLWQTIAEGLLFFIIYLSLIRGQIRKVKIPF
ncbi:MAG: oligosaccharide flippase family protein [Bacteroidetes bacterium]|nr:oligosaccharide flippase family protein [Bacteroidota bacterium]